MKAGQALIFTHEVEGRIYSLVFPVPAPLKECYEVAATVCNEFLKQIKAQEEKEKQAAVEKQTENEAAPVENQG